MSDDIFEDQETKTVPNFDLDSLDNEWDKAGDSELVPPGLYTAILEKIDLITYEKDGDSRAAMILKFGVMVGEKTGLQIDDFNPLHTDIGRDVLKRKLTKIGVPKDMKFSTLVNKLDDYQRTICNLKGVHKEGRDQTFVNVFIQSTEGVAEEE